VTAQPCGSVLLLADFTGVLFNEAALRGDQAVVTLRIFCSHAEVSKEKGAMVSE
jgi:hypothetical protein